MNKVLLCPSAKVAHILLILLQKYLHIYTLNSKSPCIIQTEKYRKGKTWFKLLLFFFLTCEPFPSVWKKPLDLLKEKHPSPQGTQNIYQTGKKKEGTKKQVVVAVLLLPGGKNLFDSKLCILSWKPSYRNDAQRDRDDALQCLLLPDPKVTEFRHHLPEEGQPFTGLCSDRPAATHHGGCARCPSLLPSPARLPNSSMNCSVARVC